MKNFVKSEKFIYIMITVAFLGTFLTVYLKTEQKLSSVREASPVVIHDVTLEKSEDERTVYITASGKKYHLDGCNFLGDKKIAVTVGDAEKAEFEPCAYCSP